jgi:integrase
LKAEGTTNNTWNNRLSMIRQVFAHAVADGRLSENPADNTLWLRKSKGALRLPFSDDDAARILLAARKETAPSLRWAHWIMAFSGMRVGEVLQLTRGDVGQWGAIWFLDVNEDAPGKTVKTGQRRHVPVHPALLAEGFIEYVESLPADAALFPDKRADVHGNRGGRGWNQVGKWVRETVGITDERKVPNHSWGHRMEDELRTQEVPEDARDAILGHARKTTGRQYGIRGEALARLHRELSKVPVPHGVALERRTY